MSDEQRRQLQQQLWKIADSLRGKMHADEFRDYMLGFIFYKYLSEKIALFADRILEADERQFVSLAEENSYIDFFLLPIQSRNSFTRI